MKIELRTHCKVCNKKITGKRYRTYCSAKCRSTFNNKKNQWRTVIWGRKQRDKEASVYSPNKVKCLVCGKYYVQVGTHVIQAHDFFNSCREYREYFDLERKRGIVPEWYREIKGKQAIENGTFQNLKNGKKFRFIPGDSRAGNYKRSKVTLQRLSHLSSLRKYAKK